jgi:hypothetical protein
MSRRLLAIGAVSALAGALAGLWPVLIPAEVLLLAALALGRLRARFSPPPVYDLPVFAYRTALWLRSLGHRRALR